MYVMTTLILCLYTVNTERTSEGQDKTKEEERIRLTSSCNADEQVRIMFTKLMLYNDSHKELEDICMYMYVTIRRVKLI